MISKPPFDCSIATRAACRIYRVRPLPYRTLSVAGRHPRRDPRSRLLVSKVQTSSRSRGALFSVAASGSSRHEDSHAHAEPDINTARGSLERWKRMRADDLVGKRASSRSAAVSSTFPPNTAKLAHELFATLSIRCLVRRRHAALRRSGRRAVSILPIYAFPLTLDRGCLCLGVSRSTSWSPCQARCGIKIDRSASRIVAPA